MKLYHVLIQNASFSNLMLLSILGLQMAIPLNVRHVDFLTKAEKSGREIGLGIWAQFMFQPMQSSLSPIMTGYIGNARSLIFHRPER